VKDIGKGKKRLEKMRRKEKGLGWMAARITANIILSENS